MNPHGRTDSRCEPNDAGTGVSWPQEISVAGTVLLAAETPDLVEYLRTALPDSVEYTTTMITSEARPSPESCQPCHTVLIAVRSSGDPSRQFLRQILTSGTAQLAIVVDAGSDHVAGMICAKAMWRDHDGYRTVSSMTFQAHSSQAGFRIWLETTLLLLPPPGSSRDGAPPAT